MTISSTTRQAGPFIGNDTAANFPFTFKVFQKSDLSVVESVTADDTSTDLVLDSDYSAALNSDQDSDPGGTVTLIAGALATGNTLLITSAMPNLQPTELTSMGGFYPSVINDALDRAVMLIQQLQVAVDASLKQLAVKACVATIPGTVYTAPGNVAAVFVNGVLQAVNSYTTTGAVITFGYTLDPGDVVNALCTTY